MAIGVIVYTSHNISNGSKLSVAQKFGAFRSTGYSCRHPICNLHWMLSSAVGFQQTGGEENLVPPPVPSTLPPVDDHLSPAVERRTIAEVGGINSCPQQSFSPTIRSSPPKPLRQLPSQKLEEEEQGQPKALPRSFLKQQQVLLSAEDNHPLKSKESSVIVPEHPPLVVSAQKPSVVKRTIKLVKSQSVLKSKKKEDKQLEQVDTNNNTVKAASNPSLCSEKKTPVVKQAAVRFGKFLRSLGSTRKASYELVSTSTDTNLTNKNIGWWSVKATRVSRNDSKRQRKIMAVVPNLYTEDSAENISVHYSSSNHL